jgi:hypothetical protein
VTPRAWVIKEGTDAIRMAHTFSEACMASLKIAEVAGNLSTLTDDELDRVMFLRDEIAIAEA